MPARKAPAALLTLQVTVEHPHDPAAVAQQLAALGFTVQEVLDAIGVVIGSAPASAVARLKKVNGVCGVEPTTPIDLGPSRPEGGTTW